MNKKTILLIILSILATFAGFFWYFSSYIKKKTSSSSTPQTGNKDSVVDNIVITELNEKVQSLIDKNIIIYVDKFSLIPDLDIGDERIIVVKVDETNRGLKSTYLQDANGLTLISSQSGEEFTYVTSIDGILNI